ncbi:MAG: sugar ABC transporter permease [Planctomycetota bacterium]|nr:sugar ABC transporter permease [Planctomycetota bacterium]
MPVPRARAFVVPWILGLLVFTLYPFAASFGYSFTDYSVLRAPEYVGGSNYAELASDAIFQRALLNTLVYAMLSIPAGVLVALGFAKALHAPVRGTSFYRAAIYVPHLVPTVASAILWMWLLNPGNGLVATLLRPVLDAASPFLDALGGWLGQAPPPEARGTSWKTPSFMQDGRLLGLDFKERQLVFGAMPSLVLLSVWGVGQMAIVYLAKLQDVPRELYEAARIDGAGGWAVFRHVELPQLSPVILFNVVMAIIGAFQLFAEPYIMTGGQGGPDYATYLVPMFIYDNAFDYHRMGYACAASWILFGLIALLTLVAFRVGQRRVHYAGGG